MKAVYALIVFQLYFGESCFCQTIPIGGLFPTIDHRGNLSDRLSYNAYTFGALKPYTSNEGNARPLYIYGECGLSFLIANNLWITASYVYENQQPFGTSSRNEHRLFQQLTHAIPINRFLLKQRLRFDERFIQNIDTDKFEFSHRIRYLFGTTYNVNDTYYVMSYTEFFFNTTSPSQFRFNENWSALQLGYHINQNNSIEGGYLFVGWIYNDSGHWFNQHYLQATWVSRLDFTNPKKSAEINH